MDLTPGLLILIAVLNFFITVLAIYLGVTSALRRHDTYRLGADARVEELARRKVAMHPQPGPTRQNIDAWRAQEEADHVAKQEGNQEPNV